MLLLFPYLYCDRKVTSIASLAQMLSHIFAHFSKKSAQTGRFGPNEYSRRDAFPRL